MNTHADQNLHWLITPKLTAVTSMALRVSSPEPLPYPSSSPRSQRSHASGESLLIPFSTSPKPIESERENAPFKPGPNDETSLDMHHRKTKWKANRRHHPSRSNRSEERRLLLPRKNLDAENSGGLWDFKGKTPAGIGSAGFDCSLIRQDSVVQYRRKLTSRQQLSQVDEDAHGSVTDSEEYEPEDALTFARAASIHRRRGDSLVCATAKPLASLVNAICIISESTVLPEESSWQSFSFATTPKHRVQSWNESRHLRSRKQPSFKSQETPASITLRKASQIVHADPTLRSKSIANRFLGWFQDSEIFQPSNHLAENQRVKFDLSTSSHDTSLVRQHRLSCVAVSQSAQLSFDLLGGQEDSPYSAYSRQKRHSVTTDSALTYAEIQPINFSCSCSGGKQALAAMGGHRKPSRSSIRTGSSVHEIIWAKDDAPSSAISYSFDLTKSASLSPVTDRDSIGYGSISVPTSSIQALHRVYPPKSATFPRANRDDIGPINDSPLHLDFSNWSWRPESSQENFKLDIKHRHDSDFAKDSESQKAPKHKEKVRSSSTIAGPDTVESFPPLLNRRRTSEWQRLPLVDLNDPHAGREQNDSREQRDVPSQKMDDEVPNPSVSALEDTEEQDLSSEHEPVTMRTLGGTHGQDPGSAAMKLARARQSINSRQSRRASANIGISKASRISKHRRSISDGSVPNVAALLAQASRIAKKSTSTVANDDKPFRRPSIVSTRRSKSVQSLPASIDAPVPVTTQDPSVRLVEVAGADEGEGEDVGCLLTPSNRNKSRLSLSLDWIQ